MEQIIDLSISATWIAGNKQPNRFAVGNSDHFIWLKRESAFFLRCVAPTQIKLELTSNTTDLSSPIICVAIMQFRSKCELNYVQL